MKKFIWKRKVWKRIGISIFTFMLTLGLIFGSLWLFYVHLPDTQEVVQFNSQQEKVEGTLIYPDDSKGPFPAVIILHGSSPDTREEIAFTTQAKAFIKKGFAVLIYDRRGTGRSEGSFRSHDYKSRISDIYSALDFLRNKPEIRSNAIGLATNSESGFLAPQIASEQPDVAFIYNRVGPVVDFTTLSLYQIGILMANNHDNPGDVKEIMKIHEDIIEFYVNSAGNPDYFYQAKNDLDVRMAASWKKNGPFLPYGKTIYFSRYNEDAIHRIAYSRTYDPRTYFDKSFNTPLYYAFSELDANVPTNASVAALEKIMKREEHNIQYKVWPNVSHKMVKVQYAFFGAYPPGYLNQMASWCKKMVDEKLE